MPATINVGAVVGRFNVAFETLRKDIATLLGDLRTFFVVIGKPKGSESGLDTTCLEIESKFPAVLDYARELEQQLELLNEQAELCAYSGAVDRRKGRRLAQLRQRLDAVIYYVQYFANKLGGGDAASGIRKRRRKAAKTAPVREAAKRAIKHRKTILGMMDKASATNKEFGKAVVEFLRSIEFQSMVRDPHSDVAIKVTEIIGSKAERRELIALMDSDLLEEQRQDREQMRALIDNDIDDETGAPRAYTDGASATTAAAAADDDDDNDDDDDLDELAGVGAANDAPDEDVRSEELEDDDDEDEDESEENKESSDDDGGSENQSEGGVLFEQNLEKVNAELLREAEATTEIRNGRAVRKRKYRAVNLDEYAQMDDALRVDDRYDGEISGESEDNADEREMRGLQRKARAQAV